MKKLFALLLVIALVLAMSSSALAVDIPAGKITLTAQPVDYQNAQRGIAQPVTKTYVANERYAVLVSITIPSYMDTAGLVMEITPRNCTVENTNVIALVTGDYLIAGTILSSSATIKVAVKDNAINEANTANELWAALYGDRTVSATATMGVETTATQATQTITGIPKTGMQEDVRFALILIVFSALCLIGCLYLLWTDKERDRHA